MPHDFRHHGGYVEMRLHGVLRAVPPLPDEERAAVRAVKAILLNFRDVEDITLDPYAASRVAREYTDAHVRIALLAERPAWFGVGRQLEQLADRGAMMRTFREHAAAVGWLLHGEAR